VDVRSTIDADKPFETSGNNYVDTNELDPDGFASMQKTVVKCGSDACEEEEASYAEKRA
jgi:hypothetical protein